MTRSSSYAAGQPGDHAPCPSRARDAGHPPCGGSRAFRPGYLRSLCTPDRNPGCVLNEDMRYVGSKARLQGLSPLESSLSSVGCLGRLMPGALLGFQPLQGSSLIALGRCYHQPSSHRLGTGSCSRRSAIPQPVLGSPGWLPLRVSQSDEAGRSLARSADPHEVPCLVVQPLN
jgi:hypothetical protein